MSDTILAALIGALGAALAALIPVIVRERRQRKEAEEGRRKAVEERQKTESAALLPLSSGEMPAVAYTMERRSTVITFDDAGDGTRVDRFLGVRSTQSVTNLLIPLDNWVECPGGEVLQPSVRSLDDAALGVRLDGVSWKDGRVRGFAEVTGYHSPDSRPVNFEVTIPFRQSFCTTREDVERAYAGSEWKTEYASTHAIAPTANLDLEVRFPESHRGIAKPQVIVFFQRGETVVGTETERVKSNLEYSNCVARLVVPAPNSRVRYAIAWMPPARPAGNDDPSPQTSARDQSTAR